MDLATVPAAPPARKNQRATSWPAPISAIVPYHLGSRLIRRAFCSVSAATSTVTTPVLRRSRGKSDLSAMPPHPRTSGGMYRAVDGGHGARAGDPRLRCVPARLVVLASGEGSTLQALLDAAAAGSLGADVVAVGSDRPGCRALQRAAAAGVPTFARALADFPDRDAWNAELADALAAWQPDLVVLAGFMRVLAPSVVRRFRIVNTHPSLLPDFPGAHAVRDALEAAVPTTGVTIHWVDDGVDTGPVLAQEPVEIRPGDDEDSLRERIQAVEKPLYVATIRRLLKELPDVTRIPVRRALVSVSDKTGLAELA